MLESITPRMRNLLLESLYKKYDEINRRLQSPFLKMHYESWQIVDMKSELDYIDILIDQIKRED